MPVTAIEQNGRAGHAAPESPVQPVTRPTAAQIAAARPWVPMYPMSDAIVLAMPPLEVLRLYYSLLQFKAKKGGGCPSLVPSEISRVIDLATGEVSTQGQAAGQSAKMAVETANANEMFWQRRMFELRPDLHFVKDEQGQNIPVLVDLSQERLAPPCTLDLVGQIAQTLMDVFTILIPTTWIYKLVRLAMAALQLGASKRALRHQEWLAKQVQTGLLVGLATGADVTSFAAQLSLFDSEFHTDFDAATKIPATKRAWEYALSSGVPHPAMVCRIGTGCDTNPAVLESRLKTVFDYLAYAWWLYQQAELERWLLTHPKDVDAVRRQIPWPVGSIKAYVPYLNALENKLHIIEPVVEIRNGVRLVRRPGTGDLYGQTVGDQGLFNPRGNVPGTGWDPLLKYLDAGGHVPFKLLTLTDAQYAQLEALGKSAPITSAAIGDLNRISAQAQQQLVELTAPTRAVIGQFAATGQVTAAPIVGSVAGGSKAAAPSQLGGELQTRLAIPGASLVGDLNGIGRTALSDFAGTGTSAIGAEAGSAAGGQVALVIGVIAAVLLLTPRR